MISVNNRSFYCHRIKAGCLPVVFLPGWPVSCKVYSFKDVSIPPEVKTIRVGFIENRATYVDPQLSPQLTDKFKQKLSSQTKLIQVQTDNADYDVSAFVRKYDVSTAGVSNQAASINRLAVTVHLA